MYHNPDQLPPDEEEPEVPDSDGFYDPDPEDYMHDKKRDTAMTTLEVALEALDKIVRLEEESQVTNDDTERLLNKAIQIAGNARRAIIEEKP
jgi:hypothetical protein